MTLHLNSKILLYLPATQPDGERIAAQCESAEVRPLLTPADPCWQNQDWQIFTQSVLTGL